MSLPHQGFEIIFSDLDKLTDSMLWIDAYDDQNGSIFNSATGEDAKIVDELLEKSIKASRMLGTFAQTRFMF